MYFSTQPFQSVHRIYIYSSFMVATFHSLVNASSKSLLSIETLILYFLHRAATDLTYTPKKSLMSSLILLAGSSLGAIKSNLIHFPRDVSVYDLTQTLLPLTVVSFISSSRIPTVTSDLSHLITVLFEYPRVLMSSFWYASLSRGMCLTRFIEASDLNTESISLVCRLVLVGSGRT